MNRSSQWETIQIRKKKLFIWGIIVLALIYLFTPLAIIQFICLFLFFILTGSRFYAEYLIRNIRVSRIDSELRVFRYDWVRVEIKVENHGLLPAFMLISGDLPGQLNIFKMNKIICNLFHRSWILHCWEGYCSDRGVFTVGPAIIRGSDPLGLFPFHLTGRETSRLYVYPVLRAISVRTKRGIPPGNMINANPLFEDITRYRSLRPYNQGDEPRRINWKASAHVSGAVQPQSGNLLVNEYEAATSYPLMVFLNADQNEYPMRKRRAFIERTIEASAAICLMASRKRQELGIIIYTSYREGGISVIAPSTYTLVPILERLAALNWIVPAGENQRGIVHNAIKNSAVFMLDQGKHLPYGTRYIYTGPDLGDEAYINLNSLKKYHVSPEYLIIDERSVHSLVPGNSPRYQMKESGYEVI